MELGLICYIKEYKDDIHHKRMYHTLKSINQWPTAVWYIARPWQSRVYWNRRKCVNKHGFRNCFHNCLRSKHLHKQLYIVGPRNYITDYRVSSCESVLRIFSPFFRVSTRQMRGRVQAGVAEMRLYYLLYIKIVLWVHVYVGSVL